MALSDGQIIAALSSVNTAEISVSTLALSRAVSSAVRNHAESMVTVHNTAQERQAALATTLNLTLDPSPLSNQLTEDATLTMTQLSEASDDEFDAVYLRSQVEAHMKVLMLISEQLLPSAKDDKLRTELMQTRDEVATHLDAARNASGTLADTDAGTP
jgi:predicted outer membrane protein